jgi:membrane-bound ClpP family serine protease
MGNTTSTNVTNKVLNKNVNKSDIEALNQQVSEFVTSKITNSAQKCSSSSTSVQTIDLGNITASGPGSSITSLTASQDSSLIKLIYRTTLLRVLFKVLLQVYLSLH